MRPYVTTLLTLTLTLALTATSTADYTLACGHWYQRLKCSIDGAICQGRCPCGGGCSCSGAKRPVASFGDEPFDFDGSAADEHDQEVDRDVKQLPACCRKAKVEHSDSSDSE
ncbi:uncharacterized protein C8A04DRAFT_28940 [Dichotomopilus funicola]|uniref:Uncharacterized protein n=1 Tax=Dichotomopilus funicola TaxID=1934379 RepID=A0AAN6ZLC3_9PEZI|nr:hypothetical protein C8A04DRAFT_28940 [Dichotomopilus funicola]